MSMGLTFLVVVLIVGVPMLFAWWAGRTLT